MSASASQADVGTATASTDASSKVAKLSAYASSTQARFWTFSPQKLQEAFVKRNEESVARVLAFFQKREGEENEGAGGGGSSSGSGGSSSASSSAQLQHQNKRRREGEVDGSAASSTSTSESTLGSDATINTTSSSSHPLPHPPPSHHHHHYYLTVDEENALIHWSCMVVLSLCHKAGFDRSISSTACAFLQRFYVCNKLIEYPPQEMITAAILAAIKVEACPYTEVSQFSRRLGAYDAEWGSLVDASIVEHIASVASTSSSSSTTTTTDAHNALNTSTTSTHSSNSSNSNAFAATGELSMLRNEVPLMMMGLKFQLSVHHPHVSVRQLLNELILSYVVLSNLDAQKQPSTTTLSSSSSSSTSFKSLVSTTVLKGLDIHVPSNILPSSASAGASLSSSSGPNTQTNPRWLAVAMRNEHDDDVNSNNDDATNEEDEILFQSAFDELQRKALALCDVVVTTTLPMLYSPAQIALACLLVAAKLHSVSRKGNAMKIEEESSSSSGEAVTELLSWSYESSYFTPLQHTHQQTVHHVAWFVPLYVDAKLRQVSSSASSAAREGGSSSSSATSNTTDAAPQTISKLTDAVQTCVLQLNKELSDHHYEFLDASSVSSSLTEEHHHHHHDHHHQQQQPSSHHLLRYISDAILPLLVKLYQARDPSYNPTSAEFQDRLAAVQQARQQYRKTKARIGKDATSTFIHIKEEEDKGWGSVKREEGKAGGGGGKTTSSSGSGGGNVIVIEEEEEEESYVDEVVVVEESSSGSGRKANVGIGGR